MKKGLILTMGMQPSPLIKSILEIEPEIVIFIGTETSFKTSLNDTVDRAGLKPNNYSKIKILEDASKIGDLCLDIYKAYNDLKTQGCEKVLIDPTGGRKWMSAAAIMTASFLGLEMLYVEAPFKDGKPDEEKMELINLGNAYDQTGFILAGQAREFFNLNEFEQAANFFKEIKPTKAANIAFYEGLGLIADAYAKWDRFEHYQQPISTNFSQGIEKVQLALNSGYGSNEFNLFLNSINQFITKLKDYESKQEPSLTFIIDILENANRCIIKGRYDDAVARLYRATEAISQLELSKFDINTSNPNYEILSQSNKDEFLNPLQNENLPEKIGLKEGFWLLYCLGNEGIKKLFPAPRNPYKNFKLEKILNKRNNSILAHGFEPVNKDEAKSFYETLSNTILEIYKGEYSDIKKVLQVHDLPQMPI